MNKKLKPFTIIFKPKIVQTVHAVDWDDAVEFFKSQIKQYPIEFDDVESFEIEDGSPKPEKLLKLYSAMAKAIEQAEMAWSGNMFDIRNISFREEDEDEFRCGDCNLTMLPDYVYCDLHEFDGCGEHTICKDAEYDTSLVMKHVMRLKLLKEEEES